MNDKVEPIGIHIDQTCAELEAQNSYESAGLGNLKKIIYANNYYTDDSIILNSSEIFNKLMDTGEFDSKSYANMSLYFNRRKPSILAIRSDHKAQIFYPNRTAPSSLAKIISNYFLFDGSQKLGDRQLYRIISHGERPNQEHLYSSDRIFFKTISASLVSRVEDSADDGVYLYRQVVASGEKAKPAYGSIHLYGGHDIVRLPTAFEPLEVINIRCDSPIVAIEPLAAPLNADYFVIRVHYSLDQKPNTLVIAAPYLSKNLVRYEAISLCFTQTDKAPTPIHQIGDPAQAIGKMDFTIVDGGIINAADRPTARHQIYRQDERVLEPFTKTIIDVSSPAIDRKLAINFMRFNFPYTTYYDREVKFKWDDLYSPTDKSYKFDLSYVLNYAIDPVQQAASAFNVGDQGYVDEYLICCDQNVPIAYNPSLNTDTSLRILRYFAQIITPDPKNFGTYSQIIYRMPAIRTTDINFCTIIRPERSVIQFSPDFVNAPGRTKNFTIHVVLKNNFGHYSDPVPFRFVSDGTTLTAKGRNYR